MHPPSSTTALVEAAPPASLTVLGLDVVEAERAGLELPCRAQDPELWFAEYPAQTERAKSLCAQCPVREACLAGALHRGEVAGVWGGQLLVNGAIVAHKRGRGRPRKIAA